MTGIPNFSLSSRSILGWLMSNIMLQKGQTVINASACTALTLRSLSPARYKGILSFTPTIGAPQQSVSYIDIAFHFPSHEYTGKHYFFSIKGEINHLLTLNLMFSLKLFYINETPQHNTSRICVSHNHKRSPKTQLLPQGTPREYSFQKVSLY